VCVSCCLHIERTYRQSFAATETVITSGSYVEQSASEAVESEPCGLQQSPCIENNGLPKETSAPRKQARCFDRVAISKSVAQSLRRSQYFVAIRKIISCCPAARRAFNAVVMSEARNEMRTYIKEGSNESYPQFSGTKTVEDFSWSTIVSTLRREMPTVTSALIGSMPRKSPTSTNEKLR